MSKSRGIGRLRKTMLLVLAVTFILSSATLSASAAEPGSMPAIADRAELPEASAVELMTRPFQVYSNYIDFKPAYVPYCLYQMLGFNLSISSDGGATWQSLGRHFPSYSDSITGLTPNTNYLIRANDTIIANVHTGMPSLPIKSIRASAIKVKYHRKAVYGYYTGLRLGTTRYYTYKVRVTVKMKKKPGTKGIFINGEWVRGNKKTYTKTIPTTYYSYSNPHGKKFGVIVYSGFSPEWGGYSPMRSKKVRMS